MATRDRTRAPVRGPENSGREWSVNTFDGKQDWRAYWAQFQMVARFNNWSPRVQAMHLVKSLIGGARTIIADMTTDQMENLPRLVAAVEKRYCPREKIPAHRAIFNGRRQKVKESAQEFAEELRMLVLKAFPQDTVDSRESRLVDKFVDGLLDAELKKHVALLHPENLEIAASIAVEWEAFDEAQWVNGVRKPKDKERACVVATSESDSDK